MKCMDCNLFVSYGETQIQDEDITLDSEIGLITAQLVLPCENCDTALKQVQVESDFEVKHTCDPVYTLTIPEGQTQYIVKKAEFDGFEREDPVYSKKDPEKQLKAGTKIYGANYQLTIECTFCRHLVKVEGTIEAEVSEFEEV